MDSLYAAVRYGNTDRYYISHIAFGPPPARSPAPKTLGSTAFLPEEQAVAGFAKLSGLAETDVSDLLNGVKRVQDIPALDYCIPIKSSQRTVVGDVYYYCLPNGIHLVGLHETHPAVQQIKRGEPVQAVEFSDELTSALCNTKGSKKRSRKQVVASGVACTLHMPDPLDVLLPDAVRHFDVVEVNTRLTEDPSLLSNPEEGWIVMLMDKSRTSKQPKHKRN